MVVLDELQWMANYRSLLVSDLKMVWDQYWARIPGVKLVLCGSIASFMVKSVVRSTALYGRTDRVIHLREFTLAESAQMLPAYGLEELLDAYMILGGVPKYQELARDYTSLYLAVEDMAFRENGFFVDEWERIFVSHFGRNEDYARIVRALAEHPYGLLRQTLAKTAVVDLGGGLTRQLYDLESAGFIASVRPIGSSPNTKRVRYYLSDPYLRFYHALMLPEMPAIRTGRSAPRFASLTQRPAFHSWRGRAFELVCARHAARIARELGFGGIEYSSGPFFLAPKKGRKGVQIDLVFNRADNVLTLCEMKCSRTPIGEAVIEESERKAAVLREAFPRKSIQCVLIHHGSLSRNVSRSPYLFRCLDASVLVEP